MLTISHVAAEQLQGLLRTTSKDNEAAVIRMVREKRRYRLQVDSVHQGDTVFSYHGRAVLVLDDWVARLLSGSNLDIHEVDGHNRLKIEAQPPTPTRRGSRARVRAGAT